jgi:hypothetical protein
MLAMVHPSYVRGVVAGFPAGASDASLILRPLNDLFMADIESWPLDKDGHFQVREVLPGSYATLLVFSSGGASHTVRGDQIVQVANADIDGLRIAPLPNGDIRGQIRTEDDRRIDWSQLEVSLYSDRNSNQKWTKGSYTSSGDTSTSLYWEEISPRKEVKSSGWFELKDVPADTYHLQVAAANDALADYFVKTVNLAGRDVTDPGFATTGVSQLLDVILSADGAVVEGTLLDDKDHPVPYVKVFCIPGAAKRQRQDLFQGATTDLSGHFRLRGLAPGEYQVIAVDEDIDEEITDPEFISAHESEGLTIKVQEGERKSIILKLPPSSD